MPTALPIERFLAAGLPVIDVRSPGEHAHGHIPGAQNLPLFTDDERAQVGTLYKQAGRDPAMLHGMRLVGPKLAELVERSKGIAQDGRVGVHCWRGGERSASVAWLLEKVGGLQVITLQNGYKAFRALVQASFTLPRKLRVLGGYTGTGKTELLALLRAQGQQVVDLEGLAHHKGSSFGSIGQTAQPGTEQFENLLWNALRQLDPARTTWVEDESRMVGRVKLPDPFFAQMRTSPVTFMDMPRAERVVRLVKDYGGAPMEELSAAVHRIQRRLGPQHAKAALEALEAGDLHQVAEITLVYYDKTYARGLAERDPALTRLLPAAGLGPTELATLLLAHDN
ncbi:MAG: tRNA 2-selenouridine(34) synthase MnmH [Flavobacteriales bacterium]|nr:tRNA 2-selenouridine(34) synthase MnmH [Flavobacteriales bacterium]MBP9080494.1 tRNA 2-selenouridine(34) synthase MnmH [Flavobacteriales bacterium]